MGGAGPSIRAAEAAALLGVNGLGWGIVGTGEGSWVGVIGSGGCDNNYRRPASRPGCPGGLVDSGRRRVQAADVGAGFQAAFPQAVRPGRPGGGSGMGPRPRLHEARLFAGMTVWRRGPLDTLRYSG